MVDYITQSAFARRWGVSRQYISKLIRRGGLILCANKKLDLVLADLFMIKSGAGLLLIPDKPERREQYHKRREIRLSIIAETARWGGRPYTPRTWQEAVDWIKDTYAPHGAWTRTEAVLRQLNLAGLTERHVIDKLNTILRGKCLHLELCSQSKCHHRQMFLQFELKTRSKYQLWSHF